MIRDYSCQYHLYFGQSHQRSTKGQVHSQHHNRTSSEEDVENLRLVEFSFDTESLFKHKFYVKLSNSLIRRIFKFSNLRLFSIRMRTLCNLDFLFYAVRFDKLTLLLVTEKKAIIHNLLLENLNAIDLLNLKPLP